MSADLRLTDAALFDGGDGINPNATLADMIAGMFEVPGRAGASGASRTECFLRDVLCCAADEFLLIERASQADLDSSDLLARITLRAEWRIRVALELATRIRAAQVSPDAAEAEEARQ